MVRSTRVGTINLDKLSLKDLIQLERDVAAAIVERKHEEKAELKQKIAALAEQSGFDVGELFGGRRGRRAPAAIKYRNPKNPDETWTGRGRKPNWLTAALKKGQKIESFLV